MRLVHGYVGQSAPAEGGVDTATSSHKTPRWAAGNGDYIYGKRRLREIDRRIRFLSARLERAELVDPRQQKKLDQVFFGATVT